jgi:site-specific recombinase XerD
MTALAPHLTDYLVDHLPRHRNASPHTVATYAYSFTLLVRFAAEQRRCRPIDLKIEDLDPDLILAFLDHIEAGRQNSVATRNARLAAVRSFFRYIEYKVPACLDQVLRIHALPRKRTEMRLIDALTVDEIRALLAAPACHSYYGLRDRAMLHMAYACGLRASELLDVQMTAFPPGSLATVRIHGKGRRERILPLWRETQQALRGWLGARGTMTEPTLFISRLGEPLSRDGLALMLAKHVRKAALTCPSLLSKRITPHVLRHSCAAHTLAATGDIRKVSLWLGHASLQSTEVYLRADPVEKLAILAAHAAPGVKAGRFKAPSDKLLAMLAAAGNSS